MRSNTTTSKTYLSPGEKHPEAPRQRYQPYTKCDRGAQGTHHEPEQQTPDTHLHSHVALTTNAGLDHEAQSPVHQVEGRWKDVMLHDTIPVLYDLGPREMELHRPHEEEERACEKDRGARGPRAGGAHDLACRSDRTIDRIKQGRGENGLRRTRLAITESETP